MDLITFLLLSTWLLQFFSPMVNNSVLTSEHDAFTFGEIICMEVLGLRICASQSFLTHVIKESSFRFQVTVPPSGSEAEGSQRVFSCAREYPYS